MKESINTLIANLRLGEEKSTEELVDFADGRSYTEGSLEMFDGKVLFVSEIDGINEVPRSDLVMCFALKKMFPRGWKKEEELIHYVYDQTGEDIQVCVFEDGWSTEQVIELLEGID